MRRILAAALLLLTLNAQAQVDWGKHDGPIAIGLATFLVMRYAHHNSICTHHPCDYVAHVAIGAGLGYYLTKHYDERTAWTVGLSLAVIQELADRKRKDPVDVATMALGTWGGIRIAKRF